MRIESFSGIPHYGFFTLPDIKGNKPIAGEIYGWIPAAIVGQTEISL